jgi:hypothetical protein
MKHHTKTPARQTAVLLLVCISSFSTSSAQYDTIPKFPLFSQCRQFYGGLSTILEDSKPDKIMTFGPNIGFTYPINKNFGLTADAGLLFGSSNNTKYTKFQLYGGASLLSVALGNGNVSLSPHLLAGYSNTRSKYESATEGYSQGCFSMLAGTNINFPIGRTIVRGTLDYNPVFAEGHMHSNIRAGIGIPLASCPGEEIHTMTTSRPTCKASKDTREIKASFTRFQESATSTERTLNRIPRVEVKIRAGYEVNVKQGEACCSPDLPPASYTEFRGGLEGGIEINFTLWGIPDIHYSVNLWPFLLITDFQCKAIAGGIGKISLEPVGRFYGELFGPGRPDCQGCWYINLKSEVAVRAGVKLGGGIYLFRYTYLGRGKGMGYDIPTGANEKLKDKADEAIEVYAEAFASVGTGVNGTYGFDPNCATPPQGVHGTFFYGKAKVEARVSVKLGPLSFDPKWEFNLFDGFTHTF